MHSAAVAFLQDRVRPRLRALGRTAIGDTPEMRERINSLRQVYRESIVNVREYYYDARRDACTNPRNFMCNTQDGATQS